MNHVLLLLSLLYTPCAQLSLATGYYQFLLSGTFGYFLACVGTFWGVLVGLQMYSWYAVLYTCRPTFPCTWVLSGTFGYSLVCVGTFRYRVAMNHGVVLTAPLLAQLSPAAPPYLIFVIFLHIPDLWLNFLHTKARKSGQNRFCNKTA